MSRRNRHRLGMTSVRLIGARVEVEGVVVEVEVVATVEVEELEGTETSGISTQRTSAIISLQLESVLGTPCTVKDLLRASSKCTKGGRDRRPCSTALR